MKETSQEIQISLIGARHVGKTALINRLVNDQFDRQAIQNDELYIKPKNASDSISSTLNFIKLPSGKAQKTLRQLWYPMTDIYLLLFALDNVRSFEALEAYRQEIKKTKSHAQFILVGSRCDKKASVAQDNLSAYQNTHHLPYFEISAKTKKGIDSLMDYITSVIPTMQTQPADNPCPSLTKHTNSRTRQEYIKKHYEKYWITKQTQDADLAPNLQNIRQILADYCAYIPSGCFPFFPCTLLSHLYLILTGHWRHHVRAVSQIVSKIDSHKLSTQDSVIDALNTLRREALEKGKFNKQGTLSLRLSFIKTKCSTPSKSYQDEDESFFKAPSCCAI